MKTLHVRSLLLLVLVLALTGLMACDDTEVVGDPTDGDTTDGDEPDGDEEDGDADGDIPVVVPDGDEPLPDGDEPDGDEEDGDTGEDGDEEDGDVEEEPGEPNAYRLNQLVLTVPAEMQGSFGGYDIDVKSELNNQLATRIANYQANLILRPETIHSVLSFPYLMTLLIAEKNGAVYVSSPDNSYALQVIQGAGERDFTTQNDLQIAIPVGGGVNQDFIIRETVVSGTYSDDLERINQGVIAGVVHEDDANSIVVYEVQNQPVTLANAFWMLGMQPDYTFGDGKKGYTFIFTYTAEAIVNVIEDAR